MSGLRNSMREFNCQDPYEETNNKRFEYQMYLGSKINKQNCVVSSDQKFYSKNDLINIDSDLKGLTRPINTTRCDDRLQYNLQIGEYFAKNAPVVIPYELCSKLSNNVSQNPGKGF